MLAVYYMPVHFPMVIEASVALMVGGVALLIAQMTPRDAKRLLLALLAALFVLTVAAFAESEIVMQDPGKAFCDTLEPWGWWFYFFGCQVYYGGR